VKKFRKCLDIQIGIKKIFAETTGATDLVVYECVGREITAD